MSADAKTETALNGLKVLDLSRILAGPSATQILGDLGADIVKIEHPDGGDDTRGWGPPFIHSPDGDRIEASYFACCNRNKRSVVLDFNNSEDRDTLIKLASKADVLVENFKPGSLAKFGLDFESLQKINSSLIYCSITGFGQTGPYSHKPGYDFLIQGMGGLMSVTGQADGQAGAEPLKVGVAICDLFTGLNAVTAILAALHHRTASGIGQYIDCSLLDSQAAMLANQSSAWLNSKVLPQRMGNNHPSVVPYRVFAASDGHLIINCGNDRQFQNLCAVIEMPELSGDSRFKTNEQRCKNRTLIDDILASRLMEMKADDIIRLLESVSVPCGPINTIPDVFSDPHVKSRATQVSTMRDDGVVFSSVAYPPKLSETPARYERPPPRLGEHNEQVLHDWGIS
jgi:crotonobetainyl-CoA:carnitine CoA-transferase CaiB-like acyl-CoA transferase